MNRCWFILLAVTTAHAEMYKCVKDGAPVYQDTPCDKSSVSVKTDVAYNQTFAGCFEAKVPFVGYGGAPTTKFAIQQSAGRYSFMTFNPNAMPSAVYTQSYTQSYRGRRSTYNSQSVFTSTTGTLLKSVSREELDQIGKRFNLTLTQGISTGLAWNGNPNTQRPIGIYVGSDQAGKPVVLASLQNGTGRAEHIACPSS